MTSALRRVRPDLWRYRRLLVPGLVCAFVSALVALAVPGLVREAVDAVPRMVAVHGALRGTPAGDVLARDFGRALVALAALIVGVSAVSGLFIFLMRQLVVVASRHIEFDLRNRLYAHLQTLSGAFRHRHSTGDLMTRATSDVERVRRYVGPALMYLARAVAAIVTALAVMLAISPALTVWSLLPMPLLAVAVFLVSRLIHDRTDRQQAAYSSLTSRVQEALAGVRVVKAYAQEDAWTDRVSDASADYRARSLDLARVDAAFRPVLVILIGLSTVLVVGVGGRMVVAGDLSLGNVAEFILYVTILTWPVASFGYVVSMVQQASASMERLSVLFDETPEITGPAADEPPVAVRGALAADGVSFRYAPDGPDVLAGVSFDVPAGTTLGIVGRTGSGKSTLVELLLRRMDPTAGRLTLDGRDLRDWPLGALRGAVGYVPQEVFLFSDTLGANVAFGALGASDDAIRAAADEADLLATIESFPDGLDTRVGERGVTLSGGQKQRTAIARALIRQPPVLVLDDALSAVDTRTEAAILGHLRAHAGERTVVIVSHRISAVQDADQILVLEAGRVAERGTHAALVDAGGLYAAMVRRQQIEAEIEEGT